MPHCGIVRLPDLPAASRIRLMTTIIDRYADELENGAILTVGEKRVRISKPPAAE
jgi:predicted nuclease of predicted toxin-antitoxin system